MTNNILHILHTYKKLINNKLNSIIKPSLNLLQTFSKPSARKYKKCCFLYKYLIYILLQVCRMEKVYFQV